MLAWWRRSETDGGGGEGEGLDARGFEEKEPVELRSDFWRFEGAFDLRFVERVFAIVGGGGGGSSSRVGGGSASSEMFPIPAPFPSSSLTPSSNDLQRPATPPNPTKNPPPRQLPQIPPHPPWHPKTKPRR